VGVRLTVAGGSASPITAARQASGRAGRPELATARRVPMYIGIGAVIAIILIILLIAFVF
jgi:hypothetical protein